MQSMNLIKKTWGCKFIPILFLAAVMAILYGCEANPGNDEKLQLERELSAKCEDTPLPAAERAQPGEFDAAPPGEPLADGSEVAATLGDRPYEKMVEALGGYGERVEDPEEIRPALERARDSGKAACLNVIIDPKQTG